MPSRLLRLIPPLALMTAVLAPMPAMAVTVSVTPADTTVFLGDSFTLRVTVDAVPDLKGFDLVHTHDPAVLGFAGAGPGDVLTASGRSYFSYLLPDVSAPTDSVWYDAAMLQGGTSGPGILMFVHYTANAIGDSYIHCLMAELRDSFNASLGAACADGVVHVTSRPVPTLRSSWGTVKLTYR